MLTTFTHIVACSTEYTEPASSSKALSVLFHGAGYLDMCKHYFLGFNTESIEMKVIPLSHNSRMSSQL